jgi:hypothetical protein
VELGRSQRRLIAAAVPGIGYECFEPWLRSPGTAVQHVRQFGYDATWLKVDALSSSGNNARQIRDAIMAMPPEEGAPRLVLIGYSKGAPDILEAIVSYPEIRSRVAAVVSAAGSVGGSALANDAEQYQADLLRHFPGAKCGSGDGGGVASLRPATRQIWLAQNPLPHDVRYYSLVTFPQLERISAILVSATTSSRASTRATNRSLRSFREATCSGYLNADRGRSRCRSRTHSTIASFSYAGRLPARGAARALLRFIEEDLAKP